MQKRAPWDSLVFRAVGFQSSLVHVKTQKSFIIPTLELEQLLGRNLIAWLSTENPALPPPLPNKKKMPVYKTRLKYWGWLFYHTNIIHQWLCWLASLSTSLPWLIHNSDKDCKTFLACTGNTFVFTWKVLQVSCITCQAINFKCCMCNVYS